MKVTYIKDKEYDAWLVWVMLSTPDPSGNENRANSMGINEEAFKKISSVENFSNIKDFVLSVVDERYKIHVSTIEAAIINYQKAWDVINEKFSHLIVKVTGYSWFHDNFYVVVSPFHPGVSSSGGDTVARSAFEDPQDQLRISAHEILMSHIWSIMFKKYPESKKDKYMHYWGLNEIATTAVLGLENSINKLWTLKMQGYNKYLSNYPQLKPLQEKLKTIYLNSAKFDGFLDQGLSLIKKEYSDRSL